MDGYDDNTGNENDATLISFADIGHLTPSLQASGSGNGNGIGIPPITP